MIQFRRGYQAFVGTFIVIAVGEGALITPNSPNLFFSPANWAREQLVSADRASSVAVAVNAGAYFRLTFTGSQVAIVQLIATNPGPVSTHYMNVSTHFSALVLICSNGRSLCFRWLSPPMTVNSQSSPFMAIVLR
eukprot:m.96304 g.96304  ORF g.96304 m.96304 type:complete len:135 (+) comp12361_c0_seq1:78-482(+)